MPSKKAVLNFKKIVDTAFLKLNEEPDEEDQKYKYYRGEFLSALLPLKYRVIKLKWKIVKAWYSLMPILSDLKFFVFERTLIDVFCIKMSKVMVKDFVFYIIVNQQLIFTQNANFVLSSYDT